MKTRQGPFGALQTTPERDEGLVQVEANGVTLEGNLIDTPGRAFSPAARGEGSLKRERLCVPSHGSTLCSDAARGS
jgi:hypothetical protein